MDEYSVIRPSLQARLEQMEEDQEIRVLIGSSHPNDSVEGILKKAKDLRNYFYEQKKPADVHGSGLVTAVLYKDEVYDLRSKQYVYFITEDSQFPNPFKPKRK